MTRGMVCVHHPAVVAHQREQGDRIAGRPFDALGVVEAPHLPRRKHYPRAPDDALALVKGESRFGQDAMHGINASDRGCPLTNASHDWLLRIDTKRQPQRTRGLSDRSMR